jgi:hypothetical protein
MALVRVTTLGTPAGRVDEDLPPASIAELAQERATVHGLQGIITTFRVTKGGDHLASLPPSSLKTQVRTAEC